LKGGEEKKIKRNNQKTLIERIPILDWGSTMKRSWEHRHANDSSSTATMYATATATDIIPTAGAKGGEGN
jgi:hypothetical protein